MTIILIHSKNGHWIDFLTSVLSNNNVFAMVLETGSEIIGAAIMSQTEKDNDGSSIVLLTGSNRTVLYFLLIFLLFSYPV